MNIPAGMAAAVEEIERRADIKDNNKNRGQLSKRQRQKKDEEVANDQAANINKKREQMSKQQRRRQTKQMSSSCGHRQRASMSRYHHGSGSGTNRTSASVAHHGTGGQVKEAGGATAQHRKMACQTKITMFCQLATGRALQG